MIIAITISALFFGADISALYFQTSTVRFKRERFIREFVFSKELFEALRAHYPEVDEKSQFLIARALRTFFLSHLRAGEQVIGMPSKAADALWHEFILDTRAYTSFCDSAFGSYFHHVPARSVQKGTFADETLQRAWRFACLEENINPKTATRLPLLFALDTKIAFPDGNTFSLAGKRRKESDSGCGGSGSECFGSSSDSGHSSDSSGGDGACGGGCSG